MIPKSRIDALTDGVFAFAMTLLVIDLRLPEHFQPKEAAELLHRLGELSNQVIIYVISFYVLAIRWTGMVRTLPPGESVSRQYAAWALTHLLLITFVPFTTMVMGRASSLAPAVWLYAANIILFSLIALRMITLAESSSERSAFMEYRIGLIVLIVGALLSIAVSFTAPRWAMIAYLINLIDGPLRSIIRKKSPAKRSR